MNETLLMQLLGTAFGGMAAWVAIRVEVALAKKTADDAVASSREAHQRLDEHIDRHHTIRGQ